MTVIIKFIFAFVLLASVVNCEDNFVGKKWTDQTVEIETLELPKECTRKSGKGDVLTTEYVGTFMDGKKFDSTYDRKEPMKYTMGNGDVIKGCEIATMNMCVGEKRHMVIPSNLAYGDKEYGQIPPGSTLQFVLVLIKLEDSPFKGVSDMFASSAASDPFAGIFT